MYSLTSAGKQNKQNMACAVTRTENCVIAERGLQIATHSRVKEITWLTNAAPAGPLTHYQLSELYSGQCGRGGGATGASLPTNVTHVSPLSVACFPHRRGGGRGKKRHNCTVLTCPQTHFRKNKKTKNSVLVQQRVH